MTKTTKPVVKRGKKSCGAGRKRNLSGCSRKIGAKAAKSSGLEDGRVEVYLKITCLTVAERLQLEKMSLMYLSWQMADGSLTVPGSTGESAVGFVIHGSMPG